MDTKPRTAEQQLAAIEKLCRAGDLSLGQALKHAYHVGMNEQADTATTGKDSDG